MVEDVAKKLHSEVSISGHRRGDGLPGGNLVRTI